jgi:pimeloyl-ACP methyl ester carboxylesterase
MNADIQRHAIALIPGFFGFNRVGTYTYWADRFLAGVRASVQAALDPPRDIPVVPVSVPTIGSLAERQRALIRELDRLDTAMGGPFAWHLVGHSTGGLDAALLLRTHALREDADGSHFADELLRLHLSIRSVVTIAAPHFGSSIVLSELLRLTWAGRVTPEGLFEAGKTALDLVARRGGLNLKRGSFNLSRLRFGLGAALEGDTLEFLRELLFDDHLARDLQPTVASRLTLENNRLGDAKVHCIATFAPTPPEEYTADRLFADLWRLTADKARAAEPSPPAAPWPPPRAISFQPGAVPAELLPTDSDGVVNTMRQWDGSGVGFAGVVVADHADVLGLYQRNDPVLPERVIQPGLLTSGAHFQDDQFFQLCGLVGGLIAPHIR